MKQIIFLTILSIIFILPCSAQKKIKTVKKNAPVSSTKRNGKLNQEHPTVYATFENYSKYTWNTTQESYDVAWFRLHNNFSGDISFCQYDTSVSATGKIGVHYEIEKSPDRDDSTTRNNENIPRGFTRFDFCRAYSLKSGANFLFGIVQNHLIKNTRIKIQIFYPWEDEMNFGVTNEPQHYIYIYANDLPTKNKNSKP